MRKDTNIIKSKSIISTIITSTLFSISLSFLMLTIAAVLISNEKLRLDIIYIIVPIIHFLSTFSGIYIASMLSKKLTLKGTGITLVTYALFYTTIAIVFFDGLHINVFWNIIAVVCGGVLVTILYYSLENKSKKPRKRKRNW